MSSQFVSFHTAAYCGRDDAGQVLKYLVFSPPLQATIKPKMELTLAIVTPSQETPQGIFVNHKVVSVNEQSGVRQIFGGRTYNAETRAIIVAMKAADIVSQLRMHGELAAESILNRAALAWCHKALTSERALGVSRSVSGPIPIRLLSPFRSRYQI